MKGGSSKNVCYSCSMLVPPPRSSSTWTWTEKDCFLFGFPRAPSHFYVCWQGTFNLASPNWWLGLLVWEFEPQMTLSALEASLEGPEVDMIRERLGQATCSSPLPLSVRALISVGSSLHWDHLSPCSGRSTGAGCRPCCTEL